MLRHYNTNFLPDADIDTKDIVDALGGLGFDPRDGTCISERSARCITTTPPVPAPIWVSLTSPTPVSW